MIIANAHYASVISLLTMTLALISCTAPPPVSPTPLALITPSPTPTATATPTIRPTATPTLSPTPAPTTGTVSGTLCYPSSEAPPLLLFLEDADTGQVMTQEIDQGESAYRLDLPPGEYVAYAHTVGTETWGGYTRRVAEEPKSGGAEEQGGRGDCERCEVGDLLPFVVAGGDRLDGIDLCDWDHAPGFRPPAEPDDDAVTITTIQNTNLYPQPVLATERLVVVPPRTQFPAVARTPDNAWFQIEGPTGERAWLYGRLTQIEGNIFGLPMVEPHKNLVRILADYDRPRDQFQPTAWSAAENGAIVHFRGFIRDKFYQPINGYSVLLDNGTWSVLSHPSGASHHYPDTEDGEWDLIIENASDAAGWWALTVVSYDCPDFEIGFNAQCKQFTPLSETQIVQVVYPDENVIFADWRCLRDCDRGLYIEPFRRPADIAKAKAITQGYNYIEDFYRGEFDRLQGFYPADFFEPEAEEE